MYKFIKRLADLTFAITALIIFMPLMLIVTILIMIDSKGNPFFSQERIGYKGKVFRIYKFRMYIDSENKGSGCYVSKNDKRVTRIGKILRATSIDELPQLINVLFGQMSLIGPRPVLTYHPWPYEKYSEEQKRRFDIRPGITGWAQINGRKSLLWEDRIKMDIFYIDNLSFMLDLKIFFKTIIKVFHYKDNFNTIPTAKSVSSPGILNDDTAIVSDLESELMKSDN